jgi:hypothetical protein
LRPTQSDEGQNDDALGSFDLMVIKRNSDFTLKDLACEFADYSIIIGEENPRDNEASHSRLEVSI